MLEAVVAVYADWGIGANGTQPIVISEDRKHFREITGTGTVIVGRKTLAAFPGGKPLPKRRNIILTGSELTVEGAVVVHSSDEALKASSSDERVFVIGGATVYREFYPYLDRVYVTRLDCTPVSDCFFPNLDEDTAWNVTEQSDVFRNGEIEYQFLTYERMAK